MGMLGGDKRMEGFLFYWLFWIGWIVTTFFYPKKHPDRLKISAWILVSILSSDVFLQVDGFEVSGSGVFILFIGLYVYCSVQKETDLVLTSYFFYHHDCLCVLFTI